LKKVAPSPKISILNDNLLEFLANVYGAM